MYYGHLNRKNNMPRKNPLLEDYNQRVGSETPDRSNRYIILALGTAMIVCGWIYILTSQKEQQQHDGCIASAYQATQNGFDLEANLQACE